MLVVESLELWREIFLAAWRRQAIQPSGVLKATTRTGLLCWPSISSMTTVSRPVSPSSASGQAGLNGQRDNQQDIVIVLVPACQPLISY
jgi:hypothetical protein